MLLYLFCEDSVIPKKHVKVYANNKPWVTISLKQVLIKKDSAFHNGVEDENTEATKEVRAEIKRAKLQYKNKIEESQSISQCIRVIAIYLKR